MNEDTKKLEGLTARGISKDRHRRQLLEAAAEAIAIHGISGTTTARIQELSGLSKGMINLHFQSKDRLLLAVARHLSEEYNRHWRAALALPGQGAAARLQALIRADFSPQVLNKRNIAIWFAFRADARAHPEYHPYVDSRSTDFREALTAICSDLIREGNYRGLNLALTVNALTALLEGMWTDFHLNPDHFDAAEAEAACLGVARGVFPEHF